MPGQKQQEEWRAISWWPDHEVSSVGRVRRSRSCRRLPGHQLTLYAQDTGYQRVVHRPLVHMLVAEAFLGRRPKGRFVNHKNGDKSDNRSANLEYVTPSDNAIHAYETGLQHRGQEHGRAKLTEVQVLDIRAKYTGEWGQQSEMAREYGVTQTLISQIVKGEVWTHLTAGQVSIARRKRARGEKHGNSSVTDGMVRAIRDRYAKGGITHQELADLFGISQTTVSRIIRHRIWKHIE